MTLAQIKSEIDALNARWEACYGTDSDEERGVKTQLADLRSKEMGLLAKKPQRKPRRPVQGDYWTSGRYDEES